MNRIKKWIVLCVVLAMLCGCMEIMTPEGPKTALDPNAIAPIERVVETAVGVGTILLPVLPWLVPFVTAGVGILGTWRKIKPKLTAAQTEAEMYHTVASSTVLALEDFKKLYPKEWENIETQLEKIKNKIIKPEDRLKIDNIIRALRGLPPKK